MAPTRDRRPGFSRRAQYSLFLSYILAVAGAIVGAVLIALSTFDPQAFAALRAAAAEITTPVASTLSAGTRTVAGVPTAIASWYDVHGENARLRAENVAARRLLMQARTLGYDNRRLRRLLPLREADPQPVIVARLVGSSGSSTRRYATLNAGIWQGVREGQPVAGPDGLVGRVLETGPNTARVLLLIDPESVVPVRRTRDGLPAIVVGRGDGTVEVRTVASATGDFRAGDVFVTSGTGGIYRPGLPVARVIGKGVDSAPARAFADADTLDFAAVSHVFMPDPPPARRPLP